MQKKTKIIIAIVCTVLFVAGIALGLYFGLKDKPAKTVFAETGTVEVFDKNTVKFSYVTPYIEKGVFEIIDKEGFVVKTDDKTIDGKIVSIEYRPTNTETVKSGEVVITADLSEKLIAGASYHATVKAGTVEHTKEDYVNPDITADFKVKEDDNGMLHAEEEKFKDAKAVVLANVEPKLYKKDGKAYTTIRNLGATIPPEELPLLFERFHKADYSRSMDREGVGLGLYIVKTILNNLKENITVTSEDGVTQFTFTLTLA